jgi:hypothetical protein
LNYKKPTHTYRFCLTSRKESTIWSSCWGNVGPMWSWWDKLLT